MVLFAVHFPFFKNEIESAVKVNIYLFSTELIFLVDSNCFIAHSWLTEKMDA